MADTAWLDWPFLQPQHVALFHELEAWCSASLPIGGHAQDDVGHTCRRLVRALGEAGWLRHGVPAGPGGAWGGALPALDSRTLCILRETLARHDCLADFAFAMQGLGSAPISLAGSDAQRRQYLPRVATGQAIAAFALSEPGAGSDVAALACCARRDGDAYVLDGQKTWISNAGIADFYCVFARTGEAPGSRGISAFLVDAGTPGLDVSAPIPLLAPHPLATLTFSGCRVPADRLLGEPDQGFKLAMQTLDIFRASVAAAALGMAKAALGLALEHVRQRAMFGGSLADLQLTQAGLADMATAIDASALLTYRAAWRRDTGPARTTREAAMAKMTATESAQQVIDRAQQMFGAAGLVAGSRIEQLYRDVRALRIYEGATEVQKVIIARELLKS
ncbi:acyl-CoA dehydrogenase family protein [Pigmentiphaga soli]|uniref:Acyl-CoA dehydrogenase family protein n=1 Tax=Pigmentiphaga soli TaxID=1007095 RepID=A0ABP8HEG6_9BURK